MPTLYVPTLHEEQDLGVLHSLIAAHPLGTWATQAEGGILMNHLPFILDAARGPYGTLMGHVARTNAVWKSFSPTVESVVAFQGAEAYISPSWYASKSLHGKVVPTWNYAVVHAHGIPQLLRDESALRDHLRQLTDAHETGRPEPWHVSDAPDEFIRHLSQHIVGIEIPISRIVGKWKVSQNRSAADRRGVVAGLAANGDAASLQMAALVARAARDEA